VPGVLERAQDGEVLFGNIDSFLLWHLTGGPNGGIHATYVTNASRSQLMNIATLSCDRELLSNFGIPEQILPRIRSSSEVFGAVSCGALGDVPIAGILGDQQAALVGQACFKAGEAKNTYGTGCFLLMNMGNRLVHSKAGLLTTVAYKLGEQPVNYALEGSIAIAGALVQWLRDNLGLIEKSEDVEILARTVDDNGGVYFVPALAGLGSPHWRADVRGSVSGLTRGTTRAHLVRAALEAAAYQTADVLDEMPALAQLRVDGGMTRNRWLMQFQADVLGIPVETAREAEQTALGAGLLALGERRPSPAGARFEPQRAVDRSGWRDALRRALT